MAVPPVLDDPLRFDRSAPPAAVVIFGANGDLTRRKLMPALYRLAFERRLAPGFAVVGISRTPLSDDRIPRPHALGRREVSRRLALRRRAMGGVRARLVLPRRRSRRRRPLHCLAHTGWTPSPPTPTAGNVLFYLSTQPSYYARVAEGIGSAGLAAIRRLASHRGREALRPRPLQRPRVELAPAGRFRRARHLPHRSLPR